MSAPAFGPEEIAAVYRAIHGHRVRSHMRYMRFALGLNLLLSAASLAATPSPDRIDLLVEGKDDLGRPISMTLRYFINVLPSKEIGKVIANDRIYSRTIKRLCGTDKAIWRISDEQHPRNQ